MNVFTAVTDGQWFAFLASLAGPDGRLDEVNFWSPSSTKPLVDPSPGHPLFFRLKAPVNAIPGYGFLAHFSILSLENAGPGSAPRTATRTGPDSWKISRACHSRAFELRRSSRSSPQPPPPTRGPLEDSSRPAADLAATPRKRRHGTLRPPRTAPEAPPQPREAHLGKAPDAPAASPESSEGGGSAIFAAAAAQLFPQMFGALPAARPNALEQTPAESP